MIVQEYLDKPFLVDGFKCDMRIYVLVASCDPLRVFLYHDGLLRLATERYVHPNEANSVGVFLPPATKLGQGYIFTGVCDSVHRGGEVPGQVSPLCADTPPRQTPPWPDTPPGQTPPGTKYTPLPGLSTTPLARHPLGLSTPPSQD